MTEELTRYEVISFLNDLPNEYWEGEDHHKGIYFNETHSYVMSKVFSIKVAHSDDVLPLYYDYSTDDFFEKVVKKFPYTKMKRKPRGRFLLFEEELQEEELDTVFLGGDYVCTLSNDDIKKQLETLKEKISNKRKRQSSIVDMSISATDFTTHVYEDVEKVTLINSKKMSKVNNATKNINVSLNANSFFYMLKLCIKMNEVDFYIDENNKLLTKGVFEKDKRKSIVKIAIGLSKGRG